MVLVTGFGSFPGVTDNPTAALARAVDGAVVAGRSVRGVVLPVHYGAAPERTIALARALGAELVLGTGVAVRRTRVTVEQQGRRTVGRPDAAGHVPDGLFGPSLVPATIDVAALCAALDADPSEDAGTYVCNAWLHGVAHALAVPVGFVHVPPEGLEPERLLAGIARLLTPPPGS
ncbi:MAG: pyroglutamyl-peptidase [Myxococcota bacterium]|jgi:pyroglutamyl-peptidase